MTKPESRNGLAHIFENEADHEETAADASPPLGAERTPSWFLHKEQSGIGDALAERYQRRRQDEQRIIETPGPEAYDEFKRKLDERFSQAQNIYDNPNRQPTRPTLPLSDIHGRRRLYQQEQHAHLAEKKKELASSHTPLFKMFGLSVIALLIGGGAGFAVLNHDTLSNTFSKSLASVQARIDTLSVASVKEPKPITETVIAKKAVSTASLQVNDVRGNLNSMIPLMLTAQANEGADPLALKVMGLPPASYLTKGIEITKGNWLLKPEDIAGVQLVVPQIDTPMFDVEVAAVDEKSGVLAAPVKALTVEIADAKQPMVQVAQGDLTSPQTDVSATIAPAAAPPDISTQASAIPSPVLGTSETAALITKGDGLLNSGDLASARQFYLRASELGDPNGAYGVGRTYDPKIYAALNVQGLNPDVEKAALWYKKAKDAGVAAAKTALDTLQAAK
jgi:hypothetical protein